MVLAATAIALGAVSAGAQSNTSSLMLNVHFGGTSLSAEGSDTSESGAGFGVRLGWGITRNFTLFVGLDTASIETGDPVIAGGTYGLAQAEIGGIYNFRAGKSLVPYLEAGFGTRRIASKVVVDVGGSLQEGEAHTKGMSVMFGGGINYFVAKTFALNTGLSVSSGHFDDLEIEGVRVMNTDFNAASARMVLGLTWYPVRD